MRIYYSVHRSGLWSIVYKDPDRENLISYIDEKANLSQATATEIVRALNSVQQGLAEIGERS